MILEILLLGLALANGARIRRVVGGTPAALDEFPYQGKLSYLIPKGKGKEQYWTRITECNGVIIDNKWILTAAHCLDQDGAKDFEFMTGRDSKFHSNEYKVSSIFIHPEYQGNPVNDIALMHLKDEIIFDEHVKKIDLPWREIIDYNVSAEVAGWGYSLADGQDPAKLQKVELHLDSSESCDAVTSPYGKKFLCVMHKTYEGSCMEDGGAPIVINGRVEGISPLIYQCASHNPNVFIRVFSYIDWILETKSKNK